MTLSKPVLCRDCRGRRKAVAQCRLCSHNLCEQSLFDLLDKTELAKSIRLIPQVERLLKEEGLRSVLCQCCSFNQTEEFPELFTQLVEYWSTPPRVLNAEIMRKLSA